MTRMRVRAIMVVRMMGNAWLLKDGERSAKESVETGIPPTPPDLATESCMSPSLQLY